jgi:spore coat protein U-like protein
MSRRNSTVLAAAAMLGLAAQTPAFSAQTGSITISGTVAPDCQITVAPAPGYNKLDLVTSQSNLKVATVTEQCNARLGYTVKLNTANGTTGGLFTGSSGNGETLGYGVSYGGLPATFVAKEAVVTNALARTASTGVVKDLAVSYAGTPLAADTYADTLTVTISAK